MKTILFICSFLLSALVMHGQLVINQSQSIQYYLQNVLAGSGMEIFNVTGIGNGVGGNFVHPSIGSFQCQDCAIQIPSGVVMSTGIVGQLVGPNTSGSFGGSTNIIAYDPDIYSLALANGANGAVDVVGFEFDFTATSDTLRFEYVWGSEEYDSYVNSIYNDVFGIFLSGPGIAGPFTNSAVNLAVIPGTNLPVSVNTINNGDGNVGPCMNCELFSQYQNDFYHGGNPTDPNFLSTYYSQLDGWTIPLSAKSPLVCGQVYHMKIVICDSSDGVLDSAVFLKGNLGESNSSNTIAANFSPGGDQGATVFENCGNGSMLIGRPLSSTANADLTVYLEYSGGAIAGEDYSSLPDSVVIPAGQWSQELLLEVTADGIPEGQESIFVNSSIIVCTGDTIYNNLEIEIADDANNLQVQSATFVACPNASNTYELIVSGGYGGYQYVWSNGATTASVDLEANQSSQSLTVSVTDGCGLAGSGTLTLNQYVFSPLTNSITSNVQLPWTCDEVATATFSTSGGLPPYYTTVRNSDDLPLFANGTNSLTIYASVAPFIYVQSQDMCGTVVRDTLWVDFVPPVINISSLDTIEFTCGSPIPLSIDISGGFLYQGSTYDINWQLGSQYLQNFSDQTSIVLSAQTSSNVLNAYVSDNCSSVPVSIYLNMLYPPDGTGPCDYNGGCMDQAACNYDSFATEDDGGCVFAPLTFSIVGETEVYHNNLETYTYGSPNTQNNYNWIVQGGTIISGQGTTEITVLWSYGAGNISVTEQSGLNCLGETVLLSVAVGLSENQAQLNLALSPDGSGSVVGAGIYNIGEEISIQATPNPGYLFLYWLLPNGSEITDPNYTFTILESQSIEAVFEVEIFYYTVGLGVIPMDLGVVTGGGIFQGGTEVTVEAIAPENAIFLYWESTGFPGIPVSYDPLFSFVINTNIELVAHFELLPVIYTMTLMAEPFDVAQTYGWGGYFLGQTAELYYVLNDAAYEFVGWMENDEIISSEPTLSINMDSDRWIIAFFQPVGTMYTISLEALPLAGGVVLGGGEFVLGESIVVVAAANDGYLFTGWWEDDFFLTNEVDYTFNVVNNRTLTAHFELATQWYAVVADVVPMSGGYVVGAGYYEEGTTINLQAVAVPGYEFVEWTYLNESYSTEDVISLLVNEEMNFTAVFAAIELTYNVELAAMPQFGGVVNGGGEFLDGTFITIEASPEPGFDFLYWTENGVEVASAPSYSFILDADRSFIAVFETTIQQWEIVVSSVPVEGGVVQGGGLYTDGTEVTVMALPNTGYAFINWTEDGMELSTDSEYTLTLTSGIALQANFIPVNQYSVVVNASPIVGGVVLGAGQYYEGQTVDLTAVPNLGYAFGAWVSGMDTLSMDVNLEFVVVSDMTIAATFDLIIGVNEVMENANMLVYPNPSSQGFVITYPESMNMDVYNMSGQLIWREGLARQHHLMLKSEGIYVIQLWNENGLRVERKAIVIH